MIDLYYWTTPNCHKITMFLEEASLPYAIKPINIGKGDQMKPEYLRISPNNKVPAIIDQASSFGSAPVAIFESGAILFYLAEKTGKFLPTEAPSRIATMEWTFWQQSGLGPMAGQNNHFAHAAPEKIPYAIDRFVNEMTRLYGVLNKRLADHKYLAGEDYSIADMSTYPSIVQHERHSQNLEDFPNIKRWFGAVAARPATRRAYDVARDVNPSAP